jgi:archaellum component FlaC
VTSANGILADLDPLLEFPKDLDTAITELDELLGAITEATSLLTPVPIVGEIAIALDEALMDIQEVMTSIDADIVKPVEEFSNKIEKIVKDIESKLSDVDTGIKMLEEKVTESIHTISMIVSILSIAKKIPVEGIEQIITTLVDAYNSTIDEINKILPTIDSVTNELKSILEPIADELSSIKGGFFDKLSDKVGHVEDLLNKLNPINDILSHIQVVLKPFEWVLDKAESIIQKVLSPVIDPLLAPIEEKIAQGLGLPPEFVEDIQKLLSDNSANSDSMDNHSSNLSNTNSSFDTSKESLINALQSLTSPDIDDTYKKAFGIKGE